ncbi:DNA helicase RecQ [Aerococcus tenax]|uniref:DNA helicase RecQ n=1 Tax=Aerococcus tenax TaxID=3078812 RepID=UPI0018A75563|nr:DNA helicase RecQ [Aerococcus tenax]
MLIEHALEKYFGYKSFRPGQKELIESILAGRDSLGILPTGGGKSICYQLPALILPGITLVISPLISLMKDQVDSLNEHGIHSVYLNSSLSSEDYFAVLDRINSGQVKLIYVSPERLKSESFLQLANDLPLAQIAIDEAHCVSQWGHDFRASYREIANFIGQLSHRPVVSAFTATATNRVQQDIIHQLALENPYVLINSFDRPNLTFEVMEPESKKKTVIDLIDKEEAAIIYASSRKTVDRLSEWLRDQGLPVSAYHAGMSPADRMASQNDFIYERTNIIVATNAFGMGIDKPDVRQVIHYNLPTNLESYYQEAGRAGRDGLPARAILLYSPKDILTAKFLISQSNDPTSEGRLNDMINYATTSSCLRQHILAYFGQEAPDHCQNCSNCLQQVKKVDVSREGQMILSCIVRMAYPYGMTLVTDVLKGKKLQKIKDKGFDQLSTYALLKDMNEQTIKNIISQLISEGALAVNEYKGLSLTEKALPILKGNKCLYIKESAYIRSENKTKTSQKAQSLTDHLSPEDEELFEALRELRYSLASEENVPAYIIFNNQSLLDMVEIKPKNYQEFLDISGVGPVKADKYADDFCQLIEDFVSIK